MKIYMPGEHEWVKSIIEYLGFQISKEQWCPLYGIIPPINDLPIEPLKQSELKNLMLKCLKTIEKAREIWLGFPREFNTSKHNSEDIQTYQTRNINSAQAIWKWYSNECESVPYDKIVDYARLFAEIDKQLTDREINVIIVIYKAWYAFKLTMILVELYKEPHNKDLFNNQKTSYIGLETKKELLEYEITEELNAAIQKLLKIKNTQEKSQKEAVETSKIKEESVFLDAESCYLWFDSTSKVKLEPQDVKVLKTIVEFVRNQKCCRVEEVISKVYGKEIEPNKGIAENKEYKNLLSAISTINTKYRELLEIKDKDRGLIKTEEREIKLLQDIKLSKI